MKTSYFQQIDGLRFVAIFLVLIAHFATQVGDKFCAGYYGVDLFFVISGFLITNILLKQHGSFTANYKNFIGRRILRIFPIYYLTIFILFISNYKPSHDFLFYFLTYTYNYAWAALDIPLNSLSHFWSLAVEEQFYLFWPMLILSLKSKPKILLITITTIAIVCSFQLLFSIFPTVVKYNGVGLFPQANSLSIGAIGAFILNRNILPEGILKTNIWNTLQSSLFYSC